MRACLSHSIEQSERQIAALTQALNKARELNAKQILYAPDARPQCCVFAHWGRLGLFRPVTDRGLEIVLRGKSYGSRPVSRGAVKPGQVEYNRVIVGVDSDFIGEVVDEECGFPVF